jgi:hypothetical protein
MAALFLVIAFTFTVRRRIVAKGDSISTRLAALVSLSLWVTVAFGGRWIGFP